MALWLTIFLVGLLLAFNIVYFIVHIAAGIALIIYVPAAIALSARDSESTFDHAGGEVAYLVIQQIAWLCECDSARLGFNHGRNTVLIIVPESVSGVWSALIAAWASVCYDVTYTRGRYTYHRNGVCAVVIAISALSFLHFVILLGWMSWVIHIARTTPGLSATKGFAMPTHKLLVSPSRGQAEQYSTPFPTAQVAHDDATGVARVDRGYQLTSATEAEREAELMSHAEGWQHQGAGETR
jgi:hypothetical protein